MKKHVLISFLCILLGSRAFAQQANYDVLTGEGNGFSFWQSGGAFKIHMGNSSQYHYGPVTDYSIKTNMDGYAGRGWTWGGSGVTPVAALSNVGNMQIAGTFTSNMHRVINTAANGYGYVASNAIPGNDSYFYHQISANFHLLGSNKNGTAAIRKIGFTMGGSDLESDVKMTLDQSGNVGIGTTTPADQLEVVSGLRKVGFNTPIAGITPGGILSLSRPDDGSKIMLVGTSASPTDDGVIFTSGGSSELRLVSGGGSSGGFGFYTNMTSAIAFGNARPSPVMKIDGSGNVGIGTSIPDFKFTIAGGAIGLDADQPLRGGGKWLISGNATQVTVGTANPDIGLRFDAGASGRMFINGTTGNVGIGTLSPNQKLTVNGTIYGKEVKVDLSVPGPDYVFTKSYSLRTISEVESFIDENQHLPEVPSAVDMEKNGIQLGEMNMLLLKKIEELTLYVIQQQKQIDELNKIIIRK